MVTRKNFYEIADERLLLELRALLTNAYTINVDEVKRRDWSLAYFDDQQIFDDDSINLAAAMQSLGCEFFYSAWSTELLKSVDFSVYKITASNTAIERVQATDFDLTLDESIFFSGYPTQFLVLKPMSCTALYYAGPSMFVHQAAKAFGWKLLF